MSKASSNIAEDFFPLGLASRESFCNRSFEQERLKANIRTASPTLVTSPRRYGKTSLVLNVIKQMKLPFSHIDLYAEIDELAIQNAILSGVGDALYMVESGTQKALKFVTDFFAGLNISFNFEGVQVKVEISKLQKTPAKVIMAALKKLDTTLTKKNKKVVLFFDEFQKLAQVVKSTAIEGALRHVAQESKHVCFIFSGSNRHLLNRMFDDSSKPFYNLCDRIILDKIPEEHYVSFIQEKAKIKWGEGLNSETLDTIFNLTQRHPYYLNALCHRLWFYKTIPSPLAASDAWSQYVQEIKSDILYELDLLSENQKKMLISMAKYGADHSPMSMGFITLTQFSLSSASATIKSLQKMDYVYAIKAGRYGIINPVIKYLFA